MNSECSICFEIVRAGETQTPLVTRCGHLFHDNCIKSCLPNQGIGKCPQCNQKINSSDLIRLYINEPENSARAKDEIIVQLRHQLKELNEKAQLQYDLIQSLNRQIDLETKSSLRVRSDLFSQPKAPDSVSPRGIVPKIVGPAKLNVHKNLNLGQVRAIKSTGVPAQTPGNIKFGSSAALNQKVFRFGLDAHTDIASTNSFQPSFGHDGPTSPTNSIDLRFGHPVNTTSTNSFQPSFGRDGATSIQPSFGRDAHTTFTHSFPQSFGRDAHTDTTFTNLFQPSFKCPSMSWKLTDQNASPLVPTAKATLKFDLSTDAFSTRLTSQSKILSDTVAGQRTTDGDGSTISNASTAFTSSKSSLSGREAESLPLFATSVFTTTSGTDDNVVRDATVAEDPQESVNNDIDVDPTVPNEEDS